MAYFTSTLKTVLDRRFGGKLAAIAAAADMHSPDIGRLLREEVPVTAAKLEKLLSAEGLTPDDIQLLSHAAVRDFVGDAAYRTHFLEPVREDFLREDLGGATFASLYPLSPRAEQVLRYLVNHEPDTTTALELLGKFLELPPAPAQSGGEKTSTKESKS